MEHSSQQAIHEHRGHSHHHHKAAHETGGHDKHAGHHVADLWKGLWPVS